MILPLFIDVTGWPVLVIGGGEIAFRKAQALQEAGAKITVMAPELSQEWEGYSFLYQKERYENQPLDHYRFVVAATNDKKLNETIAERCKDADILCNTASHPQKGDVIFPGTVRQGGFVAALSSEGRTPFLTKKLKEDLRKIFLDYDEETIALLGKKRAYIIENYPEDKERLLKKLSKAPLHIIKEKGNHHDITHWLQRE